MARPSYDVWFVAADTVYKGVPYGVVTDWADQGRLAADDKLRPAGTEQPWVRAADYPLVGDFLYRRGDPVRVATADVAEQLQPVELDVAAARREEEDDDVDMIPLIDISLVLLIFFMMTTAVAALSPVDVPDMEHASQFRGDKNAFTIHIDKRANDEVFYALRVGDQPPTPEDNNLPTLQDLMARLTARLATTQPPPEVRIACNQALPRERVRELARELDKLKQKDQIAFYGAEVNEAKK